MVAIKPINPGCTIRQKWYKIDSNSLLPFFALQISETKRCRWSGGREDAFWEADEWGECVVSNVIGTSGGKDCGQGVQRRTVQWVVNFFLLQDCSVKLFFTVCFNLSRNLTDVSTNITVWVKKKGNRDSILNFSKSKRQTIKLLSVEDSIFIFLSYGTLVIYIGSGMAALQ